MNRTAIYIRVSTEEQAKDGVSLAMQEDLCRKYIDMHDLDDCPRTYIDEGVSGSRIPSQRDAMGKLLIDVKQNEIDHVVVFKLDRLTRKVGDLCHLLTEFDQHNVALHGVRDKLDTDTASGRLVLHIMGAVAEWERDTIADRTRSGLAHIQSQGYHVGNPPYGWELVEHDGPGSLLTPLHPEYGNIQLARDDRANGRSLAAIGRTYRGVSHPEAGKRILSAPLVSEMTPVSDPIMRVVIGYKRP